MISRIKYSFLKFDIYTLFLSTDRESIVGGVHVVLYLFSCERVYLARSKTYLVIGISGEL